MHRTVRRARSPILVGIALALPVAPLAAQDLVLTNARIVDPATREITTGALWIEDGRIAGRGEMAPVDAPGERIDLEGRWVIPGLNDLHTHSFGNMAPGGAMDGAGTQQIAMRVLRAGVTSFLDLFGMEDYILSLRDRQRSGEIGGAEIFAAGPCFTATDGHCSEYGIPTRLIDTPEDARREVAELAPKRPDVVKVVYDHYDYGPRSMPTVDRPTFEALVATAREHELPVLVHVGTWEDVRHAVLAGAAAITHVPRGEPVPPDLAELIAERGVYHIPTLVVHMDLSEHFRNPELAEESLLVELAPESVRGVYHLGTDGLPESARAWVERQATFKEEIMESVRRLHAAGVRFLTGTDAGNWGVFQGYSVHREMMRLVEAGLSPWEALAASTTEAGDFLGRDFGVGEGDEASLVVLDASPIEDIHNTQRIRMVVHRGEVVFGG